jgi:hypothetical protein
LIDFFLDDEEGPVLEKSKPVQTKAAPTTSTANDVTDAMSSIRALITPDLVKSLLYLKIKKISYIYMI